MKGRCHDERYDGRRHDVGHGPRGSYRDRRNRSRDRSARQVSVLSLTHAPALSIDGSRRGRPNAMECRHGLFLAQFGVILRVMRHWSVRQLFALLLAVFIAVGMSLSVAQASGMTARMATMADMDMSAHGSCQDCPDQPGDTGMKAMACGNVCAGPVLATLPAAAMPVLVGEKAASFVAGDPLLHGRALTPDPYPPRTSDIG